MTRATLRSLLALPGAVLMTLSLFALMHGLIASPPGPGSRSGSGPSIYFGVTVEPFEPIVKPPPPKPRDVVEPPPLPTPISSISPSPDRSPLMLDRPTLGPGIVGGIDWSDSGVGGGAGDSGLVPLVIIQPQYPRRVAMAGIEGWVKVEFTVTENGSVTRPRVIDSKPPRVFDQSALRAIVKWKFRARRVAGQAIAQTAVQTLQFKLEN